MLADYPDWQDRVRKELVEAFGEPEHDIVSSVGLTSCRELPYDQLMALPVLDAVCRETLRLSVVLSPSTVQIY